MWIKGLPGNPVQMQSGKWGFTTDVPKIIKRDKQRLENRNGEGGKILEETCRSLNHRSSVGVKPSKVTGEGNGIRDLRGM